jgi:two-component sensor histidine kinase
MEWIDAFFSSNNFMPHGHCFLWRKDLLALHIISDALIAISYYAIPIALGYFVKKRSDTPYPWMFSLFGIFILACGTTHLFNIWTFWFPHYWISGAVKLITAIVSVATAISLIPIMPKALAIPSTRELEQINQDLLIQIQLRELAEARLRKYQEGLEDQIKQRTAELSESKDKVLQSLREKETLIRELYHRTKNTMQVIRSMLMLQAAEFPTNISLQQVVKNTEDRIQAISLVHQMLYTSQDLSQISIKEYISVLASLIMQSFNVSIDRISLNITVQEHFFLLDTAIPFGLILNELMTNSLKYAFPNDRKGLITIILSKSESNNYVLQYSDDGVGVPDYFDFRHQNTLGMKLIHSIGELQMLGKVLMESKEGVSCQFEFADNLYKARV